MKKLACLVVSLVMGLSMVGIVTVLAFDCPNAH
jgi:hypothetical protein